MSVDFLQQCLKCIGVAMVITKCQGQSVGYYMGRKVLMH